MKAYRICGLAAAWALSACGGGGGGGGNDGGAGAFVSCAAITGGDTRVMTTNACAPCTARNERAAIDGDTGSFATLALDTGAAGIAAIRVIAQPGIVYPAHTPATVIYGVDREGFTTNTAPTLSTYLQGALQETHSAGSIDNVTNSDVPTGRRGFLATEPFDAIELRWEQTGSTAPVLVQVHEFCTNFD